MKNILGKIVEEKVRQLPMLRSAYDKGCFNVEMSKASGHHPKSERSLMKQLSSSSQIEVIAEIKRGSPSKGLFAKDLDIETQAVQYAAAGAGAISVLTDKKFFYGGYEDLQIIRPLVATPILCKDFIVDEVQIDIAKSIGADIILLIVAIHTPRRLKELLDYAVSIGLEVLMEVHNKEELAIALALDHPLIGVNNRNLKTFETDIQVSLDLIKEVQRLDVYMISESGIRTAEDIKQLSEAGFKGVLVGESLIRSGVEGNLINQMTGIGRCI